MLNKKNAAINLIGSILPIGVILISVPLYLHTIGAQYYGVLALIWAAFGYFGIFDFGVARAVTNAIAKAEKSDFKLISSIASSALALAALIGSAAALLIAILVLAFKSFVHDPTSLEILKSAPLLIAGIPVLIMTSTLTGAIDGLEKFAISNFLQVVGSVFYQISPLALALHSHVELHDLINIVVYTRIGMLFCYIAACYLLFGWSSNFLVSKRRSVDLLKFGGSVAFINLLDPLLTRIDQFLLAKISGVGSVASYSIAMNAVSRLNFIPLAVSRTLFPALSAQTLETYRDKLQALSLKFTWMWWLVCAAAIVSCNLAFKLWLHNPISASVSQVAKILVIGLFSNCLCFLPYTALQAFGKSSSIIRAHLFELPIYIALLVGLTLLWGAQGAAIAWSLRVTLDYFILWGLCGVPMYRNGVIWAFLLALSVLVLLC